MVILLCNASREDFFRSIVTSLWGEQRAKSVFVTKRDSIRPQVNSVWDGAQFIIIETQLVWWSGSETSFSGLDAASYLRRNCLLKAPIIFFSFLGNDDLAQFPDNLTGKFGLLSANGSALLSFPFRAESKKAEFSQMEPLSDSELREVVVNFCDMQNEWALVSHKLGNLLRDIRANKDEIKTIVEEWAQAITTFAPTQVANLENFRKLLYRNTKSPLHDQLKKALEVLDDGLKRPSLTGLDLLLSERAKQTPAHPPKGFSKLLVVDDESQSFLINSLRNQYGYDVIKEQAYKLSQAKSLLEKEKPAVVLSDYYFKESTRESELPDKSVGDKFIHYALTHPQYADSDPKKPIVLVTSKATLRPETDIRAGALDCSGANRATDPAFIHSLIWAEARNRGVIESEEVSNQNWGIELRIRQRLAHYEQDLPQLMKQWNAFSDTIRGALRSCRLLAASPLNDSPDILTNLTDVLTAHETEELSFATIVSLFAKIDDIHEAARTPPDGKAKHAIRNILHGRIEQFSSVTNAIRVLLVTLTDVTRDLIAVPEYRALVNELRKSLDQYSESQPIAPLLVNLNEIVARLLAELPSPTLRPVNKSAAPHRRVKVVVAEDQEFWRDFLIRAINRTKEELSEGVELTYETFDNAADALAAIPDRTKSSGFEGRSDQDLEIAIVDIYLPENRQQAAAINSAMEGSYSKLETPDSLHGLNLIRTLCAYKYNIPLIVFSTADSVNYRRRIQTWGVPQTDFLAKSVDDENSLVRALVRKIEKEPKHVVRRFEDNNGIVKVWIDGVEIPFTGELERTFSAIYFLRQSHGKKEFSISQILQFRGDLASEQEKKPIQDHVYRIRNLILETLQRNGIYVNVRQLIRTKKSREDEYLYELNAEIGLAEDQENYEADLEQFENQACKVLVVETDQEFFGMMRPALEGSGYEVRHVTDIREATELAVLFRPHVLVIDLFSTYDEPHPGVLDKLRRPVTGFDLCEEIRTALRTNSLGIVVPTKSVDNDYLLAKTAQAGIPIENIVLISDAHWLNHFLTKVHDERKRVFLGQTSVPTKDFSEPIVYIMDGSDLAAGKLNLVINDRPFSMNRSPVAKIIGLLLNNPKTTLPFKDIKRRTGRNKPLTQNDSKNWTKRIRSVIRNQWLRDFTDVPSDFLEHVLESSGQGLQLNVQVVDLSRKSMSRSTP